MQNSIDVENKPVPSDEGNVPGDLIEEKQEVPLHPSIDPKNQQEYWRWVQLQILRERSGKNSSRE